MPSNGSNLKIDHNVRPDSMLVLHVAREVVEEEGFAEILANVRDRIDEIESLHRTRELTVRRTNSAPRLPANAHLLSSSKILIKETKSK